MDITSYLLGKNASSGGGGGGTSQIKPKSISFTTLTDASIDVSLVDMTQIYSAQNMFADCYYLTEIKGWTEADTSNITLMNQMFQNAGYFATGSANYDFSGFSIASCSTLNKAFMGFAHGISNLSLDLSSFENTDAVNTGDMFSGCTNITHIDLRKFDFTKLDSYSNMFGSSGNGVPDDCEIIVADDTQKTWVTTNFSRLINVKTVAEYEA